MAQQQQPTTASATGWSRVPERLSSAFSRFLEYFSEHIFAIIGSCFIAAVKEGLEFYGKWRANPNLELEFEFGKIVGTAAIVLLVLEGLRFLYISNRELHGLRTHLRGDLQETARLAVDEVVFTNNHGLWEWLAPFLGSLKEYTRFSNASGNLNRIAQGSLLRILRDILKKFTNSPGARMSSEDRVALYRSLLTYAKNMSAVDKRSNFWLFRFEPFIPDPDTDWSPAFVKLLLKLDISCRFVFCASDAEIENDKEKIGKILRFFDQAKLKKVELLVCSKLSFKDSQVDPSYIGQFHFVIGNDPQKYYIGVNPKSYCNIIVQKSPDENFSNQLIATHIEKEVTAAKAIVNHIKRTYEDVSSGSLVGVEPSVRPLTTDLRSP